MKKSKSEKIILAAITQGIPAAQRLAAEMQLGLYAVDAGPGSRVEVWNRAWTRRLAVGPHVSRCGNFNQ